MPKTDFQSQFSILKISSSLFIEVFVNSRAHSMITSIVKTFYYLKWRPIFEGSALCLFTTYNNFHLKCWVCIPLLKICNPYFHAPNHLSILFRHSKFPFNFRQIWHTSQLNPPLKNFTVWPLKNLHFTKAAQFVFGLTFYVHVFMPVDKNIKCQNARAWVSMVSYPKK